MHACIGKDQNFFPILLKHEKRKQEVFKWCDIDSELQTAEPTGSAKCSDFFHNLTPASPDVRRACHDSVRVTGTFVYRRLCWRFVVMTVPFTQEIKFKHLRNNSQLDKYLCIDIVKDLSAEFNYSNLKLWPRDVILIEFLLQRAGSSNLNQSCLSFIPSWYIIRNQLPPSIFYHIKCW